VVETILSFVSTQVKASELSEKLTDENFVPDVSKQVRALVYTTRGSGQLVSFADMISDS
jgi:hypothetical protein